jgi:hypothetical protein
MCEAVHTRTSFLEGDRLRLQGGGTGRNHYGNGDAPAYDAEAFGETGTGISGIHKCSLILTPGKRLVIT